MHIILEFLGTRWEIWIDASSVASPVVFLRYIQFCRELTHWLEQQRIPYPGGGLEHAVQNETRVSLSAGDSSPVPALEDKPVIGTKQRFIASGAYLKGWLRGLDMSASKTTSTVTSSNSSVLDVAQSSANDGVNHGSRYLRSIIWVLLCWLVPCNRTDRVYA